MAAKFAFFLLFCLPLALFSQTNPLARKISVRVQQDALDKALDQMAEAGKFSFAYNSDIINPDSVVSLQLRRETVRFGLEELFGEQMTFTSVGNHVVLRLNIQKTPEEPEFITLSGYLIDGKTGEKIEYATVYESEKHESTLTDKEGKYSIQIPGRLNQVPVSFSRYGYRDTVIVVRPNATNNLTVGLMPLPREILDPQMVSLVGDQFTEELPLANFFVPEPQRRRAFNINHALARFPVQISLVPSIGTNGSMSGGMTNHLSINLLAGYSQGLQGVEIGGIANLIREDVMGVQVGGIANIVGGSMTGVQVGGINNHVKGSVQGVQIGGIYNLVGDSIQGIQISGIANLCQQHVSGLQIAGITNMAPEAVDGGQIAGLVNVSKGHVKTGQIAGLVNKGKEIGGMQIAGLGNTANGKVGGGQISGLYNSASDSITGFQISGLYNRAKYIKGIQIGLINVADTLDGTAIGLVNWSKNGYRSVGLTNNTINDVEFGLRTGTDRLYFLLAVGARIRDTNNPAWTYGGGFGTHIGITSWLDLELEYNLQQVVEEELGHRLHLVQAIRPSALVRPLPWLEVYGGPALHHQMVTDGDFAGELPSNIGQNYFLESYAERIRHRGFLGYQAGLRVRF